MRPTRGYDARAVSDRGTSVQASLRLAYAFFALSAAVVVAGLVHAYTRGGKLGPILVTVGLAFGAFAVLFPRLKGPFRLKGSAQGPTLQGDLLEPGGPVSALEQDQNQEPSPVPDPPRRRLRLPRFSRRRGSGSG